MLLIFITMKNKSFGAALALAGLSVIYITNGLANANPGTHKGGHQGGHHHHKKVEIPSTQEAPSVDLVVHKDAVKGWNLEVKVANFKFAPERINKDSIVNEGHAHLFVNGKKITRLYGSWYYLDNLEPGTNEVKVTLNTNKHEDLVSGGEVIQDTEVIQVSADKNQKHQQNQGHQHQM